MSNPPETACHAVTPLHPLLPRSVPERNMHEFKDIKGRYSAWKAVVTDFAVYSGPKSIYKCVLYYMTFWLLLTNFTFIYLFFIFAQ